MDPDPHSFFTYEQSNVWIANYTQIRIHLQCQKTTGNEPGYIFSILNRLIQCLEAELRIQIWDPVPSTPKDPKKVFFGSPIPKPYFESLVIIFRGRKFYNSFGMDKNQDKVWISE